MSNPLGKARSQNPQLDPSSFLAKLRNAASRSLPPTRTVQATLRGQISIGQAPILERLGAAPAAA